MADFTKEWIEHLKTQISGRMSIVADKMDPQAYDELVKTSRGLPSGSRATRTPR